MKQLVPHALIAIALAALIGGRGEGASLLLLAGGHLLAPIWAARMAPRGRGSRAFLVGPGSIIAVHALLIAIAWIALVGGFPEDTWLSLMLVMIWAGALVAYVVYCAIAFALASRGRRGVT